MAVHVWKEGGYIGELRTVGTDVMGRSGKLDMSGEHTERQAVLDAILGSPPMNDMGGIDVKAGERRFLEFPEEEWLHVAAVLYLPAAGFRVHVTAGPTKESGSAP